MMRSMAELAEDRLPHDLIRIRVSPLDCGKQHIAWRTAIRKAAQRRLNIGAFGATVTIHNLDIDKGYVDLKIILEGQLIDARHISEMSHISSWIFSPKQIPKTPMPEQCVIEMHRMSRRRKV